MDVKGIALLERIGEPGLRLAIRDSFDRAALVRLANACRLKFPGRRAQTVGEDVLIEELVAGFLKDAAVRRSIMDRLIKANHAVISRFDGLTPSELREELLHLAPRDAGRALFALGDDECETNRPHVESILRRLSLAAPGEGAPAAEPLSSPVTRPPARNAESPEEIAMLKDRLARLEASRSGQESAAAQASRRADQLQQEIASAHKEAHHLRKELAATQEEHARIVDENRMLARKLEEGGATTASGSRLEELSVRLHQLIRESRKMAHDIEELATLRVPAGDVSGPHLDAVGRSIEALRREVADLKKQDEEESHRMLKAIQETAAEARALRSELAQWKKTAADTVPRRKGDTERVGIFVDVQNMYYAARQLNARLDFGALMTAATHERRLIRALAYVVQNRDIDQSGFLAMLQQKNYEVRRKDLKIRSDGSSKGDWDMEMALDILRLAGSLDVVVLASGDGDFTSLVNQIKTLGPKVEVYSFPGSTAKELIEAADRHVPIDEGFLIRMSHST